MSGCVDVDESAAFTIAEAARSDESALTVTSAGSLQAEAGNEALILAVPGDHEPGTSCRIKARRASTTPCT